MSDGLSNILDSLNESARSIANLVSVYYVYGSSEGVDLTKTYNAEYWTGAKSRSQFEIRATEEDKSDFGILLSDFEGDGIIPSVSHFIIYGTAKYAIERIESFGGIVNFSCVLVSQFEHGRRGNA